MCYIIYHIIYHIICYIIFLTLRNHLRGQGAVDLSKSMAHDELRSGKAESRMIVDKPSGSAAVQTDDS